MNDSAMQPGWRRWLYRTTRGLLILIGFSPLLVWAVADVPWLHWVGVPFDAWFDYQCHREAARSIQLLGHYLPVCNRCLGIYLGLGFGALTMRPRLSVWPLRLWVGFAAAAMVLDVWTEALGMRPESAPIRLLTGLLLAYPVSVAVVWTARVGETEAPEATHEA